MTGRRSGASPVPGRLARLLPTVEHGHRYPRVTSARALSAGFNLVVAVRLLLPDTILGNPANPSYRLVSSFFVGDVPLGLGLLAFGLVMTTALYTDHWLPVVNLATWASAVTWGLFAFALVEVNLSQLGTLVYTLVAILNVWAYWHLLLWDRQVRRDRGTS